MFWVDHGNSLDVVQNARRSASIRVPVISGPFTAAAALSMVASLSMLEHVPNQAFVKFEVTPRHR